MDPVTIAIMAGIGLMNGMRQQNQFRKQMELEATREANSPFTGRGGNFSIIGNAPDPFGSAVQGGLAGFLAGGGKTTSQPIQTPMASGFTGGPTIENADNLAFMQSINGPNQDMTLDPSIDPSLKNIFLMGLKNRRG